MDILLFRIVQCFERANAQSVIGTQEFKSWERRSELVNLASPCAVAAAAAAAAAAALVVVVVVVVAVVVLEFSPATLFCCHGLSLAQNK